jgi:hypothetical protein
MFTETVEQTARPVAPGEEFPTIDSEAYGYRFVSKILTEAGKEAPTRIVTADYMYDPMLDADAAEHIVSLG